ncbi:MAG: hypothetical protein ACUVWA_06815 [Candidatus Oleimicrobiaceae bacterium]
MGAIQTFGDLIGRHSHGHPIASERLRRREHFFIRIVKVDLKRPREAWRKRALALLLGEEKIDEEVVRSMRR